MRLGTGRSSRRVNRRRSGIPFGEVVLAGCLREAIQRLNQPVSTLATLRDTLLPKLLSGELSVAESVKCVQDAQ